MHFFVYSQAVGPVKGNVAIQHDALVQQIRFDKWTVNRCIGCDSFCFATGEGFEGMLVNASLAVSSLRASHLHNRIYHPLLSFQRDQAQLTKMMNCDNYAMPFKIVLKPIAVLPSRGFNLGISDDIRLRSMYEKLQNFIEADTKQTESEIRRLTAELDQRRQKAEIDFQRICALIKSSGDNAFVSTKAMSTENIDLTPPVTPESVNDRMITIDQQLPLSKLNGKRDSGSKHSSVIGHSRLTKTINFDDDIFAFDGMHEDGSNEAEDYHKNSDSEDDEKAMKRAVMRGRSGSINIARSAPITMPPQCLLLHDVETDEEKVVAEQEMDIPSSIQLLARSVHTDSIFGELPGRPILRHNEF